MGFISFIGAVASSVQRNKKQKIDREYVKTNHPIHTCTNDEHLKWLKEGKCQCCGAESGEYKGICDECRLS